ncbi:FAD/NAD(P)-binding domain-containing protein [Meredithblackwellia eburnea MCA 4105]
MVKTALVIGAGSSGLSALDQLSKQGINVTAYEARTEVGGQWNYDDKPGAATFSFDEATGACTVVGGEGQLGVPRTAMYPGLKTNVPTTLMAYRGVQFGPAVPLFPDSSAIQTYLSDYSTPLLPFIRFNRTVTLLRHSTPNDSQHLKPGDERKQWYVESVPSPSLASGSPGNDEVLRAFFDGVVIANGHYAKPFVPTVPGLARWVTEGGGEIAHARWWRGPEAYAGKTVMVIGTASSASDVVRQIAITLPPPPTDGSAYIYKLYQSRRHQAAMGIKFDSPDAPEDVRGKVMVVTVVKDIREDGSILLTDGSVVEGVQVIIFATGYHFSFPFASPANAPFSTHPLIELNSPLYSTGSRVFHLDSRQTFYLPDPTLTFLGLQTMVIPFPLVEVQARLIGLKWAGKLPNIPLVPDHRDTPEGEKEEAEKDKAGEERKPFHFVGFPGEYDLQDAWLEECSEWGKEGRGWEFGKIEPAKRDLRTGAGALRKAVVGY